MKARDLFALIIRVLGLVGLVHVIHTIIEDIYSEYVLLGWVYYVVKLIYVLVGLYCLRGAPHLVTLAYPDEAKPAEIKPAAS